MLTLPAFPTASVGAPDLPFDPLFGFATGISPAPPSDALALAPADGAVDAPVDALAGRRPTLAAACAALSEVARALGARNAARLLDELPTRLADPTDPRYTDELRAFFRGEGAGRMHAFLHALANPVAQARVPAELRRQALEDFVEDLALCETGRVKAWQDATHRLSCMAGGAIQAAALRRDDLIQQTLLEVVRATMGRDPAEGPRTLVNFEAHYVVALGRRLGLPFARSQPHDRHFDAAALPRELVARARLALQQRVSPAAVAYSLAKDALQALRGRLIAEGIDLLRVWPATPAQQAAIDEEIAAIERTLVGLVHRWSVFREDEVDGHIALVTDPTWLAVQTLRNLMAAGAIPKREIETRLSWRAPDATSHRLRCLTEGLWWVQAGEDEDFDPGIARPVQVGVLRELDRLMATGRLPLLNAAAREGLARTPILLDVEDALLRIAPQWLVNDELVGQWWRRMGEARCGAWLDRHRIAALYPDLGPRLMLAADDAGHGALFARLLPGKAAGAALAWNACDGAGRLADATRCGAVDRLRRWLELLMIALPALTARQRGLALFARDDGGQSALACAMALPGGKELVRELVATILAVRGLRPEAGPRPALLSLSPPFREILAGGVEESLGAIGVALAHGEAESLQVFLSAVEGAHARGVLARPELRALVMGITDSYGPGHWEGFRLAMTRNHADAVGVWTRALIRIAREGVLDDAELFDALKVLNEDDSGAYHAAMREGSREAAGHYRAALRAAREDRLLSRDQVSRLLLGQADEPHALSLAAAAGHARAVQEHLDDELSVLGLQRYAADHVLTCARWCRRGGHVAIGAAMWHGELDVVRVLVAHALELQRCRWRGALFPSFAGMPGTPSAIGDAVMAGRLDAAALWMEALAAGVTSGWIGRRDMLALLTAPDERGVPLLQRAVLALDPDALAPLLRLMARTARDARLNSSELSALWGPGRRQPSPLATALLADQAWAVRLIGQFLLRLCDEGSLSSADLRQLLALRGRSRRFGRQGKRLAPPAHERRVTTAVWAYAGLVEAALRRGWIDDDRAHRWLRAWIPAPGARPAPPIVTTAPDVPNVRNLPN